MNKRPTRHAAIPVIAAFVFLTAYAAINTLGAFEFREIRGFLNYNMLADAILAGQLHLTEPVHPGRLSAPNPCDPSLPYPFILDAIIHDGKHYFTQDPLPGLIHAAWKAVVRSTLPTGVMVVLLSWLSWLLLGAILHDIRKSLLPDSPAWIVLFVWIAFGLSATQLYMVGEPSVYHEAIVAGAFFGMLGAFLFFRGITRDEGRAVTFLLSGLCFGAALASRITFVLYPAAFLACYAVYAMFRGSPPPAIVKRMTIFGLPIALFVAALLLHNYARLGDPFDFGRSHINPGTKHFYVYINLLGNAFRRQHLPYTLHAYLFSLPDISSAFPFIEHPWRTRAYDGGVIFSRETVSSIFLMMPIVLLAVPTPSLIRRARDDSRLALVLSCCATSSLAVFALLLFHYRAVSRYLYEFTPLLFVVIFANTAVLWMSPASRPKGRRVFAVVLGILFVWTVLGGVSLSIGAMMKQL